MKKIHLTALVMGQILLTFAIISSMSQKQETQYDSLLAEATSRITQLEESQTQNTAERHAIAEVVAYRLNTQNTLPTLQNARLQLAQSHDSTINSGILFHEEQYATKEWVEQYIQQILSGYVTHQQLQEALANLSTGGLNDCIMRPATEHPWQWRSYGATRDNDRNDSGYSAWAQHPQNNGQIPTINGRTFTGNAILSYSHRPGWGGHLGLHMQIASIYCR